MLARRWRPSASVVVERRTSGTVIAATASSSEGAAKSDAPSASSACEPAFAGRIAVSESARSSSIQAVTVRASAMRSQSGAPHEWPRCPRQSIARCSPPTVARPVTRQSCS